MSESIAAVKKAIVALDKGAEVVFLQTESALLLKLFASLMRRYFAIYSPCVFFGMFFLCVETSKCMVMIKASSLAFWNAWSTH